MKKKTKFISFLLILTLSFGCIIAPYYGQQIYAKALENESDEEFDQLVNSYLTGNDISDDYIYEQEEAVYQQYSEYVHFDDENASNGKLIIDETPIEEKYGAIIYEEGFYDPDFDEDKDTYDIAEDEEDAYNIAVVRMIHKNVTAMNEMVDEGLGHINNNYEFVFDVTDERTARWVTYYFNFSWRGIYWDADSEIATIFALVVLGFKAFFRSKDLIATYRKLSYDYEKLAYVIEQALFIMPTDIAAQMVAFFSNEVIANLINICSWAMEIFTGTKILRKVFDIVIGLCTPSFVDCMVILYNAEKNGVGIAVRAFWIPPRGERFGVAIKSL